MGELSQRLYDEIVAIHASEPAGIPTVNTGGLIFPALIDAHNHPSYCVLGPIPFDQLFEHRDEWRNAEPTRLLTVIACGCAACRIGWSTNGSHQADRSGTGDHAGLAVPGDDRKTFLQGALDLAEQGFKVYLVEANSAIGGKMAQLDKTYPTNDCSM